MVRFLFYFRLNLFFPGKVLQVRRLILIFIFNKNQLLLFNYFKGLPIAKT